MDKKLSLDTEKEEEKPRLPFSLPPPMLNAGAASGPGYSGPGPAFDEKRENPTVAVPRASSAAGSESGAGNRGKGWNDPPLFSARSPVAQRGVAGRLTHRVSFPIPGLAQPNPAPGLEAQDDKLKKRIKE